MAPDLLSTIQSEIDERLVELRPLLDEYDQLFVALDALAQMDGVAQTAQAPALGATRARRATTRGTAAGVIKRAASTQADERKATRSTAGRTDSTASRASTGSGGRAKRGVAAETILAVLEHGSHTVAELVVVTAMTAANINGTLRRLASDGAIVKTAREGKAAWALPAAVS